MNYRKLNAIIKRNRYFLFLIKKVINKIINYKYLIRLDIIAIFNKLRINLNSENLTIFITTRLRAYKYRVLFFELINGPSTF